VSIIRPPRASLYLARRLDRAHRCRSSRRRHQHPERQGVCAQAQLQCHRWQWWPQALHGLKGEIPEEEYLVPIGKAHVKKEGTDVTVVAVSKMVHESLKAAETLAEEGINVEVIDLLTVSPWDRETVFNSVGKTHRLVVAHEAVKSFGMGAEISAAVSEEIMDELDAPIMRVGAPFVPVPFSLEKAYLPNADDITTAIKKTLERNF
jgi:pyruvate/2-oxoglutarate/acetoin dehydrogenase E1 component